MTFLLLAVLSCSKSKAYHAIPFDKDIHFLPKGWIKYMSNLMGGKERIKKKTKKILIKYFPSAHGT